MNLNWNDASPYELGLLREALQRLLFEGCLQRVLSADQTHYDILVRLQDTVVEWLSWANIELTHDEERQVLYFAPIGESPSLYARMSDQDELTIIVILRRHLEAEYQSARHLVAEITFGDLKSKYAAEWEGARTLPRGKLRDVLRGLQRWKLVRIVGSLDQDDTRIHILPMLGTLTASRFDELTELLTRITK